MNEAEILDRMQRLHEENIARFANLETRQAVLESRFNDALRLATGVGGVIASLLVGILTALIVGHFF